jgi:hypothetical protein
MRPELRLVGRKNPLAKIVRSNLPGTYTCSEEGVASCLPAFAVGLALKGGEVEVYESFGLRGLFALYVRPNKKAMSQRNHQKMTGSFQKRWPEITVESW